MPPPRRGHSYFLGKRMRPMTPFCSLILAGGAGRRFGQPKAFALLPDGRTFLAACAEAHIEAGADLVAATLPPEATGPFPSTIHPLPLPAPDLDMFQSLVAGVRCLVRSGSWRALVIHPVDHPLVQPATIEALASAGKPCAIATLSGRHGHPVCVNRIVAEKIATGTLAGPTLRDVLRHSGASDIVVEDPGVRANCNTPEVLAAAWRSLSTT